MHNNQIKLKKEIHDLWLKNHEDGWGDIVDLKYLQVKKTLKNS